MSTITDEVKPAFSQHDLLVAHRAAVSCVRLRVAESNLSIELAQILAETLCDSLIELTAH